MSGSILIAEDDPLQRAMLAKLIHKKMNGGCVEVEHGKAALDALERDIQHRIRAVILDINMPVMDGMETLDVIRKCYPTLPVIMVTGSGDTQDAVRAIKAGAVDFITKPFQPERLIITLQNALRLNLLKEEVTRLQQQQSGIFKFLHMVGHDGGLSQIVAQGRKAAMSDIPVLITGETGVGKEIFARALHGESHRAGQPFIAINCGAIPSQLVESVLFGHEKGAFTGATEKTMGKFREANGGTIFLDEVGELPLDTQVKLLRVLQQKEVEPVGASRPLPVDVRILSATNRDLDKAIKQEKFREDLYFRLNVLAIHISPLRERLSDVPSMVRLFISRYGAQTGQVKDISDSALKKLMNHSWTGNVRELENTLHRALVLDDDGILDADDFELLKNQNLINNTAIPSDQNLKPHVALVDENGNFKTLDQIERETLSLSLTYHHDNVTHAAKALNIAKSTFYRRMKGI